MNESSLRITYRDEVGMICRPVNGWGISFCDGFAYFSNDDGDFKIPISAIESINNI